MLEVELTGIGMRLALCELGIERHSYVSRCNMHCPAAGTSRLAIANTAGVDEADAGYDAGAGKGGACYLRVLCVCRPRDWPFHPIYILLG